MPPTQWTAEKLTPTYGPYIYGSPLALRFADWGVSVPGGDFSVDVTRALASERPASSLRVPPPPSPAPSRANLVSLLQAAGLNPAVLSFGDISPGETGEGAPGSPGPTGTPGPVGGLTGGQIGQAIGTVVGLLSGIPALSIVGGQAGKAIGGKIADLVAARNLYMPLQRSPGPAPVGLAPISDLTIAELTAAAAEEAGPSPGPVGNIDISEEGQVGGPVGGPSAGAPPGPPGDPAAEGVSGENWHRGGRVTKGPPRGPERHTRLLEGEYVINPKAAKLRRSLVEAINAGASKTRLRAIIDAGR